MYKMKLEIRIEIAIKMRFFRNGNRNGFRNDNKNRKPLPTIFYLTELHTALRVV